MDIPTLSTYTNLKTQGAEYRITKTKEVSDKVSMNHRQDGSMKELRLRLEKVEEAWVSKTYRMIQ